MNLLRLFLPLFLICMVASVQALDQPSESQLQQWIKQLNHSQRELRIRAKSELLSAGVPILGTLKSLRKELPETDQRELDQVILELESRAILKQEVLPFLDLPDSTLSLEQAVGLIEQQASCNLHISTKIPASPTKFRFSSTRLHFWSAVIELLDHFNLDLDGRRESREYLLIPRQQKRDYFFRIRDNNANAPDTAYRINQVTRKSIEGRDDVDLLRVSAQLLLSPHSSPIIMEVSGNQSLRTYRESDPPLKQKFLEPFSPQAQTELPCHLNLISPEFRVDWMIPQNDQPDEAELILKTKTLEATSRQEFVFQDWTSTTISQRNGLAVVTRDQVQVTDQHVSLTLVILHSNGGPAFESHREWLSHTRIRLTAGDQAQSPTKPPEKLLQADGTTALKFTFDRPETPLEKWSLKYELPTGFLEHRKWIRYQFSLNDWMETSSPK